ncbi:MAG: hypothetical protein KI790_13530 [Cyclobacteriaceae bacterium]|nr:hypothetical protein [Cyclobacteriaceae bacterium HetDA_MAG_MS6]
MQHYSHAQISEDSLFFETDEELEMFQEISTLDPNKAALLSAVLPGLGQAYNRQYWKIPFIYAGAIVIGHYINYNHQLYNRFRTAIIALDNESNPLIENPFPNATRASLVRSRDFFERNRDFLVIIGVVFYALNIVEAHVAAHLHEFEVNDGLSLKLEPSIQSGPVFSRSMGLSLTLSF